MVVGCTTEVLNAVDRAMASTGHGSQFFDVVRVQLPPQSQPQPQPSAKTVWEVVSAQRHCCDVLLDLRSDADHGLDRTDSAADQLVTSTFRDFYDRVVLPG